MSIQTYSVDRFIGLNQSGDENLMSPACTPDAANMCTDGGELRVAYGFTRLFEAAVPGTLRIDFFTLYRTNGAEIPVVIAGGVVYAYIENAWTPVYTYQSTRSKPIYDCAQVRINTTDYLVIADGQHGMIKFDGSSVTQFGSEENASNIPVSFLTMYRGRLFAAGDAANPDRLYYSVLPGSGRTVEQWGAVEASPAVEGGHVEIGALGGDPIVAVRALSNQLLIFKKNSLYRLFGDRPSNYTVEHIDTEIPQTNHAAVAVYGDMLYFGTQNGLYYYNGVTARPCADMRCIKAYMATAEVSPCAADLSLKSGSERGWIDMALDMRALYYVALPTERSEADDVQRHEEDIKANENCLNQNFSALAQKIYEFEARIALLEAAAASNAGKTDTGVESSVI